MRATRLCAVLLSLACAHAALAQDDDAKRKDAEARVKELNARVEQLYGQGKYADARAVAEESLALAEKALGAEHPDTATCLNNLASLLQAMGDLKGARPLYERALAIDERVLGPDHPDTAQQLNNLALLLKARGDVEGARPLFERALAIHEKALGPEHPTTAVSLNNLAYVLYAKGDVKGAKRLFERAIAILEKTLGPEHAETANSLTNLAFALRQMGDLEAARPLFERALAIHEKALGPDHPTTAMSLNNLGSVLQAMGDLEGARPRYERAWRINRAAVHLLLPILSGEQRATLLRSRASQLAHFLAGFDGEGARTYEATLAWKGAALRATAAETRLMAEASADVRAIADQIDDARRELAKLALSPLASRTGEPSVAERYDAGRKRMIHLEESLTEKMPDLAKRAFFEPQFKDVQALLPDGAVLLDLLQCSREVYAWIVRMDGEPKEIRLGRADDLRPLVRRFRAALEADDEKEWKEAGQALRAKLAPALDAALDGAKALYVSPDGTLAAIPWGLLPDGEGFLIERLPIVCTNGGAWMVMASHTKPSTRTQGLLAFGDVDYSGLDRAVPPLPATKEEVAQVSARFASIFPKAPSHVLTGKEASIAAFKAEAPKARYVHVATHGFFDLEHLAVAFAEPARGFAGELHSAPIAAAGERKQTGGWNPLLLSGIVLAADDPASLPRASGASRGGWLTAEELQGLDLTGVDLVVLSACETGRGALAAGEGVLGLSRALSVAGARGFMLSLWEVPDARTRELMDGFYAGLWGERAGTRPAPTAEEALRSTQLRMLARDREAKAFRPSTWGAWVLMR